jgi:Flp pilus assembly protein TadD
LAFVDSFRAGKPVSWPWWNKALSLETVEYIAAPAVIVALVFTLYFFDYRPIQANTRLIAALQGCGNPQITDASLFQSALSVNVYGADQEIREQLLSCSGNVISNQQIPGPTKQAFFTSAMQAIQDQIAATPWKDARIYTLGGSFLASIGQFAQSEPLLEIAHQLSPAKQSIDLELSNVYLNDGQIPKAVALLEQAYSLDLSDGDVKNDYVLALVADGQESKARQLFGDDPSLFETPQIAQAYMMAKQYSKAIEIYSRSFTATSTDLTAGTQLAQAEYAAGMNTAAVATLQQLEKAHPEYKTQIDAAIEQVMHK